MTNYSVMSGLRAVGQGKGGHGAFTRGETKRQAQPDGEYNIEVG